MKKVVQLIKKIITGILGIIFFGFVIAMTLLLLNYNKYGVTQFGDTSLIIIREQMASDAYKKGDLVLVKAKEMVDIKVDDEIFVYKVDNTGAASVILGNIGAVHPDDNAISFKNGATFATEFVIGSADKVYEKVGTYLSIIQSTWGFLFIILVPSFLIFIYQLYALIVEIKYGKEEISHLQTPPVAGAVPPTPTV